MTQLSLLGLHRTVSHAWIEPFAGSLAVMLELFGLAALCGYAGNKRYPARRIIGRFWPHDGLPDRLVVADVGPWRTVWQAFQSGRGGGWASC